MDDYTLAEGEKVHERSHRRDGEGTEEETGTIIPSQEARNKLERYTLAGGGWWEYWKSVEEHKNNGKCCFEGVPSKRLFGEMW